MVKEATGLVAAVQRTTRIRGLRRVIEVDAAVVEKGTKTTGAARARGTLRATITTALVARVTLAPKIRKSFKVSAKVENRFS